ncbi:hypothetical protein [Streptomyces acidiscabies]
MPNPITGEGFDAPSPEVAYMGAPDLTGVFIIGSLGTVFTIVYGMAV